MRVATFLLCVLGTAIGVTPTGAEHVNSNGNEEVGILERMLNGQGSSSDECKNGTNEIRALLLDQDAQNELKEDMKAACKKVWRYWSEPGSYNYYCVCYDRVDRHFDDILKMLLWFLDIYKSVICSQALAEQRCFEPYRRDPPEWLHSRLRDYETRKFPSVFQSMLRFFDDSVASVNGSTTSCAFCQIGEDWLRMEELESIYIDTGFVPSLRDGGEKLCDFITNHSLISSHDSCRDKMDSFIERGVVITIGGSLKRYVFRGYDSSYCRQRPGCLERYEERSDSKRKNLACNTCKYTLSFVKKILTDGTGSELDRFAATTMCKMLLIATCDAKLLLNNCESLEGTFGQEYYAKLAENINEDQCGC